MRWLRRMGLTVLAMLLLMIAWEPTRVALHGRTVAELTHQLNGAVRERLARPSGRTTSM